MHPVDLACFHLKARVKNMRIKILVFGCTFVVAALFAVTFLIQSNEHHSLDDGKQIRTVSVQDTPNDDKGSNQITLIFVDSNLEPIPINSIRDITNNNLLYENPQGRDSVEIDREALPSIVEVEVYQKRKNKYRYAFTDVSGSQIRLVVPCELPVSITVQNMPEDQVCNVRAVWKPNSQGVRIYPQEIRQEWKMEKANQFRQLANLPEGHLEVQPISPIGSFEPAIANEWVVADLGPRSYSFLYNQKASLRINVKRLSHEIQQVGYDGTLYLQDSSSREIISVTSTSPGRFETDKFQKTSYTLYTQEHELLYVEDARTKEKLDSRQLRVEMGGELNVVSLPLTPARINVQGLNDIQFISLQCTYSGYSKPWNLTEVVPDFRNVSSQSKIFKEVPEPNELSYWIPGRYHLKVFFNGEGEPWRNLIEMDGIEIPYQSEIVEISINGSNYGTIQGLIDTRLFDQSEVHLCRFDETTPIEQRPIEKQAVVKEGRFCYLHVPAGEYQVYLTGYGTGPRVTSEKFTVRGGETVTVELKGYNESSDLLTTKLVDAKNRPIRHWKIGLIQGDYTTYSQTDEDGQVSLLYRVSGPDEAIIQLVGPMGTKEQDLYVHIASDESRNNIQISESRGHSVSFPNLFQLSFRLVNQNNQPITDYPVSIESNSQGMSGSRVMARTGNKKTVVDVFPAGSLKMIGGVILGRPDFVHEFSFEDDLDFEFKLEDVKTYRVGFFDEKGNPVTGVSVYPAQNQHVHVLHSNWHEVFDNLKTYQSDRTGFVNINLVPVMSYKMLLYYHPKYGFGYYETTDNVTEEPIIYLSKPTGVRIGEKPKEMGNFVVVLRLPNNYYLWFHLEQIEDTLYIQPRKWDLASLLTVYGTRGLEDRLDKTVFSSYEVFSGIDVQLNPQLLLNEGTTRGGLRSVPTD